jgi:hypothetical protein
MNFILVNKDNKYIRVNKLQSILKSEKWCGKNNRSGKRNHQECWCLLNREVRIVNSEKARLKQKPNGNDTSTESYLAKEGSRL